MLEVSEYQKNGGPEGKEWPWQIMDKSKVEKPAHNSKWCMVGNDKGWVSYFSRFNL